MSFVLLLKDSMQKIKVTCKCCEPIMVTVFEELRYKGELLATRVIKGITNY